MRGRGGESVAREGKRNFGDSHIRAAAFPHIFFSPSTVFPHKYSITMTRELCPIAFIRCRAAGGIFSAPLCPLERTITHIAAGRDDKATTPRTPRAAARRLCNMTSDCLQSCRCATAGSRENTDQSINRLLFVRR